MSNTKKEYEEYLNNLGCSFDDVVYLSGKRVNNISEDRIKTYLFHNKYGTMLRKLDNIAFTVGYNDWKRENEFHNKKYENN